MTCLQTSKAQVSHGMSRNMKDHKTFFFVFIWFLLKTLWQEWLYIVNIGYWVSFFLTFLVGGVPCDFFNDKNVPWLKKGWKTLIKRTCFHISELILVWWWNIELWRIWMNWDWTKCKGHAAADQLWSLFASSDTDCRIWCGELEMCSVVPSLKSTMQ